MDAASYLRRTRPSPDWFTIGGEDLVQTTAIGDPVATLRFSRHLPDTDQKIA